MKHVCQQYSHVVRCAVAVSVEISVLCNVHIITICILLWVIVCEQCKNSCRIDKSDDAEEQ